MSKNKHNPKDFESLLNELAHLVKTMEEGQIPLDTALDQFEQGIKLVEACQAQLQTAEQRVSKLLGDTVVPYENTNPDQEKA